MEKRPIIGKEKKKKSCTWSDKYVASPLQRTIYAATMHNTRLEMKRAKRDGICLLMKFDLTFAHLC